MGYDLYITRREDWSDTEGPDIALDEWATYVLADKDLETDRERAIAADPRVASGAKEPTHVRWLIWPGREPDVSEAWIWLEHGNLVASDPDAAFRRKLFLIADGLNARLTGQDGEVYNSNGDPERGRSRLTPDGRKRPWWKFW